MIQVGLVGIGPLWELYRPALSRLRQPIHVEAVYDPVFARAEKAARTLEADPVAGICALAARGNVEAILVMDPGWTSTAILPLLSRQEKPVFCAPWLMDRGGGTVERSADSDVLIVPAMWRRFLPSTIRLQELIATEIGLPREIVIDFTNKTESTPDNPVTEVTTTQSTHTSPLESVTGWLDFCRNLFRAFPVSVSLADQIYEGDKGDLYADTVELRVDYPPAVGTATSAATVEPGPDSNSLQNRTARLIFERHTVSKDVQATSSTANTRFMHQLFAPVKISSSSSSTCKTLTSTQSPLPKIAVHCERGAAEIESETQIQWRSDATEPARETLASERTKEEIMLDIFCRRVIGGLVPVADMNDILKPIQLLRSCLEK